MLELKRTCKIVENCKMWSTSYNIIKKAWDWLDIAQQAGEGVGVNGLMGMNFIDSWMFDEILEIEFKDTKEKCVLLTFDRNNCNSHPTQELSKQLKVEVIKSIFINCFDGQVVIENNIVKYLFKNFETTKDLFDAWVKHVYGRHFVRNYITETEEYKIYIDNEVRYEKLCDNYFSKLGFDDDFTYEGIYDRVSKKINFTAFYKHWRGNNTKDTNNKWIKLFNGNNTRFDGVWMCEFDGTLEEFTSICDFLE